MDNTTKTDQDNRFEMDFMEFMLYLNDITLRSRLSHALDKLYEAKEDLHDSEMSLKQMRITREMDLEVIQRQAKRLKSEEKMNEDLMSRLTVLAAQAYCLLYRGKMPTEGHILQFMDKCESTWPVNTWLESLLGYDFKQNRFRK